ncbi:DUF262 domain-containing protein [Desulfuromonas sp. TF]|uniref:DUF262 domain-containing protein n=1 Tax=Desulfuromonas sp. TF TaxID=1232410 RepID=UPI0004017E45|nr:DUF262 domain-containing protein [Desulfuromonas sp. TF]
MPTLTDRELEEMYESGEVRLSQERNDFLLPQVLDFVRTRRWINLHPEYQRRQVWTNKKRSLFIESLLMNLPVPPVFLFEVDYSRYEVIDGQQRLGAISDFYENRYKLTGLEKWPGLNNKKFSDLPPIIQRGLDRRRISAVVLLAESLTVEEKRHDVRRLMFERLNTGGQNLNAQELRNCLFSGPFNDMLLSLAAKSLFNDIWEIPRYEDHIRGEHISAALANNRMFQRMQDCEVVLRFFAFRKKSNIRGAVKGMLDRCMEDNLNLSKDEIGELEAVYMSRLTLAHNIFGENTFRLPPRDGGARKLSQPLYDAVMIALDRLYARREDLLANAASLQRRLDEALTDNGAFYELVVARANTAESIKKRLNQTEALFESVY